MNRFTSRKRKLKIEFLERREVLAVELAADLNTVGELVYSEDSHLVASGDRLFFPKFHPDYGYELWTINGTTAPKMLKDILPGDFGSNPYNLVDVNGTLFFIAHDDNFSLNSLWKTDGTSEGTVAIKSDLKVELLVSYDGGLLFAANNSMGDLQVWQTDGTPAGTMLASEAGPDSFTSSLAAEVAQNGVAYFLVNTSSGQELWRTNLTDELYRVSAASLPAPGTRFGLEFFYFEQGMNEFSEQSWQLWKTDGTTTGMTPVHANLSITSDLFGGFQPFGLANANGKLMFVADANLNGWKLWTSDGTTDGTAQVTVVDPGHYFSNNRPAKFAVLGDSILFYANDKVHGTELWKSNGTALGTVLVRDINLEGSSGPTVTRHGLISGNAADGRLYFMAYDSAKSASLWSTDGTENGTVLVADFSKHQPYFSANSQFTRIGDTLYFYVTQDDFHQGTSLWKISPQNSKPERITSIDERTGTAGVSTLGTVNDLYFFQIDDHFNSDVGQPVYAMDVRTGSMQFLGDFGAISEVAVIGSDIYFSQGGNTSQLMLWKSDGTLEGTRPVAELSEHEFFYNVKSSIAAVASRLFFVETIVSENRQILWTSDGTTAGTAPVIQLPQPIDDFREVRSVATTTGYFFRLSDLGELWTSDGTAEGTRKVLSEQFYVQDELFAELDGKLYFVAYTKSADESLDDPQLWSYEISSGDLQVFLDLETDLKSLVSTGEQLYFSDGETLWISDGTPDGTTQIASVEVNFLTAIGDRVYFFDHAVNGKMTLWTSDGTYPGTYSLEAQTHFNFYNFLKLRITEYQGAAFFTGLVDQDQYSLWTSDGTLDGTRVASSMIFPLPWPHAMTSVGDFLIIYGFGRFHSEELWRYSPSIPESPHQNKLNRLDVNNDSEVRPQDILLMVDEMRRNGVRGLEEGAVPDWFVDVNGDNRFTPQDILLLVDYLNRRARYQYFPSGDGDESSDLLSATETNDVDDVIAANAMYHDIAMGIASSITTSHEETSTGGRKRVPAW